jgi:hypothetical protein
VKPTIGRIVHYRAHGSPDGTHKSAPRTTGSAAVVTIVHSETDVGLAVLNPTGMFFNEHCLYDGSENPRGGTWCWPPRE